MSQQLKAAVRALMANVIPRSQDIDRWENVQAGKEAILTIPVGPTYFKVEIGHNLSLATNDIEYISFKLNGKVHIWATPAELKKMAVEAGLEWQDDRITVYFGDPSMTSLEGQFLGEMVTKITDSWKCYVKLKSGVAAPVLTARALTMPAQPERYFLPEIISTSLRANKAGFNDIQVDSESDFFVRRLFMTGADAADLKSIEIKQNNTTFMKGTKADLDKDLKEFKRVPVAADLVVDFVQQGFGALGIFHQYDPSGNLVYRIEKAAAGDFGVLIDGVRMVKQLPKD
ncbi:major capsid protein P2 [Vibrio sp. TRT 21S02]|uniref:major capsid protein P2 n=1 Tax=Vibrio sp. TRT 21S02 TaxID=3418507 RepID=UPI003CEEA3B6